MKPISRAEQIRRLVRHGIFSTREISYLTGASSQIVSVVKWQMKHPTYKAKKNRQYRQAERRA